MRIVSGNFRGKRFSPPKGFDARPTTDIAKESLFNILQNDYYLDQIKVLDLFSGTGSISYEFYSRGCQQVTAVELNGRHYKFIVKTVEELNAGKNITVYRADAFKFIKNNALNYDIIFADPPFDMENIEKLPEEIFKNQNIKDNTLVIIEHSVRNDLSNFPYFIKQRKYGKVSFSFFSKENAQI